MALISVGRVWNHCLRARLSASLPVIAVPSYHVPGLRLLHSTPPCNAIKPYVLADIGEGITECRVIQWFVKPGDKVNQFDPTCEVQSDKASVEITSRYDGTIQYLHHEVDEMAVVGKPLVDIDTEDGMTHPKEPLTSEVDEVKEVANSLKPDTGDLNSQGRGDYQPPEFSRTDDQGPAVPAVRRMLKEHNLKINDIHGSGKGGRVLKEDVLRHLQSASSSHQPTASTTTADVSSPLSTTDSQMFNVMTHALSIPHFGYTHSVDFTMLDNLRLKVSQQGKLSELLDTPREESLTKLTPLPIILKALSMAFTQHRKLNAHLNTSDLEKPHLTLKGSHNFGIAVDTPSGLLVPVVRDVQTRTVFSIAKEVKRLSGLAWDGKLGVSDLRGATFNVSNIGSIGGHVVNPVIVPPLVATVGIGKIQDAVRPATKSRDGQLVFESRREAILSWSADHRVLDGASVARCAELVATILAEPDTMGLFLK